MKSKASGWNDHSDGSLKKEYRDILLALMGLPSTEYNSEKGFETMSKHTLSNIRVEGDSVSFDVRIRGQVKDQAARTTWTVPNMNLLLTSNSISLKALLEGYVASGHYWIKIQNWLRKCPQSIVEGFVGSSMTFTAFRAAVAAALPEGGEKAELKSEIATKDAYIQKLRNTLKAAGMTDEQIDEAMKA